MNYTVEQIEKMLEFVDMYWVNSKRNSLFLFDIIIKRRSGGLASLGCGDTLQEALNSALGGQNLDWYSIFNKMLDAECRGMMRL